MTGVQKEQEQEYPGSSDRSPEGTEQKYPGSSDRSPDGTGAEVSRFQLQEARRNRSRTIQVSVTGGQKDQGQKYPGSSDRRPEDQEQKYQIPVVTGGQKEQEKKYPGSNDRRSEG